MNNSVNTKHVLRSVAIATLAASAYAEAHGPVVVLTNVNGQIVTNQLDVTPMSTSASTADYPVGTTSRVFPSNYNAANLAAFSTSTYVANTPTKLDAIPMVLTTINNGDGSTNANTGYYGQLETTDAEGNATLDTGPGYAYGHGVFASGTVFNITFADKLKYWNSAAGSFGTTPNGEQMQAIRGSSISTSAFGNTLTTSSTAANAAQGGTGLQISVSASQNAGSHSQLMYRLLDSAGDSTDTAGVADGLYLMTFQIGTATTSPTALATSPSYFFLFEKNVSGSVAPADVAAANAYINTALVPEPAAMTLLGLGGASMLTRRRRSA